MKKMLLVLGIIMSLLGLTACNGITSESDSTLSADDQIVEEQLRQELTAMFDEYNGFVTTNTVEKGALEYAQQSPGAEQMLISWADGVEEVGGYVAIKEVKLVANTPEELRINVLIQGKERDTEMAFYNSAETNGIPQFTFTPVMSLGDKMIRAGQNTLLGMGTTFAVLILISIIISFFGLLNKKSAKPDKPVEATETNIQAIDQTIAQIIAKEEIEGGDDGELVAVIAAAIAAAEGTTKGFRVRSIRRANTSKWKQV